MKHVITSRVTRIALAAAIAAIVVPTASAQGGAVSHVYAPPPLDAGSAVPNPDYVQQFRSGPVRPDDRASRAIVHGTSSAIVGSSSAGEGFDWSDAGIGAGAGAGLVLLVVGTSLLVRLGRTEARPA